jgi:hypothetical protein
MLGSRTELSVDAPSSVLGMNVELTASIERFKARSLLKIEVMAYVIRLSELISMISVSIGTLWQGETYFLYPLAALQNTNSNSFPPS